MTEKQGADSNPEPSPGFLNQRVPIGCTILVLVTVVVALYAIGPVNHRESANRSRVSRVQSEQRALSLAIENYYVELGAYPAWGVGSNGINCDVSANDPAFSVPTFMARSEARPNLATLTTPVSNIPSYLMEAFPTEHFWSPTQPTYYAYWTDGKTGWILYSAGPDKKYDIIPWEDYSPTRTTERLINKTYDPTNGTSSAGDIYRLKL